MKGNLWIDVQNEVQLRIEAEPSLNSFLTNLVLNQESITSSLAAIIASKLHSDALSALDIKHFINDVFNECENIKQELEDDLIFFKDNDPACKYFSTPLLFYKGYLGLATYRLSLIHI